MKNNSGQSLVEFALLMPLILLLLMAIIEFGFMFNAYITLTSASREGARLASLSASNSAIETRVDLVANHLDLSEIDVSITPSYRDRGDMVTVTVNYDYVMITPIISSVLSPMIDLESETSMRVE